MGKTVYYGNILTKDELPEKKYYSRSIDIDDRLYYKIEYLSKFVYRASINKLISLALDFLLENQDLIRLYPIDYEVKNVRRSFYLLKKDFEEYRKLAKRYHCSISQIINIALYNALALEPEELFKDYKYPYEDI